MTTVGMLPLNGTQTHPLTEHARSVLLGIASNPAPRQAINPGVANRLIRECLVEEVMLMSPFKTHKGRKIAHLRITPSGRERLCLSKGTPHESR